VDVLRIRPPVIAGIYLLLAWVLDRILHLPRIIAWPYRLLGLVVLAAGISLMGWALRAFAARGTTHDVHGTPTALVSSGPFSFSRNPMYVGLSAALSGIGILIGTIPFLLVPIVFLLTMNALFIPLEEKKLASIFGQEYLDYKRRVRRWF
jgi:protein-S-isoprenylcysteine O-methyltransferase Ste14